MVFPYSVTTHKHLKCGKRRDELTLVMFYKIINHQVDIPYDHILQITPSSTRSNKKYLYLPSIIDSYLNSFFPRAIRLRNSLPDHVVEADNSNTFKSYL